MVDLVEDDQGLALLAAVAVQHRPHAHAGVGDGDPVVLLAQRTGGVLRVQPDAYPGGGFRPLLLEVLGRRDDRHLLDDVVVQQPGREGEREGGLPGSGRRDGEEIARLGLQVPVQRTLLPGTELAGGTPGRAAGEGG